MSTYDKLSLERLQALKAEADDSVDIRESDLRDALRRQQALYQAIFDKTPKELTLAQVEKKLGHRLIIKPAPVQDIR